MTKDEMEVWFEYQYSKDFYKWEKLLSQDGKKEFETFLMEKSAGEKPKNEESVYKTAKTKKRFLGIGIIASVLIASLLIGYVATKKEPSFSFDELAENSIQTERETVNGDTLKDLETQTGLQFDNKNVNVSVFGKLSEQERAENLELLEAKIQTATESTVSHGIFDDSDDIFSTKTIENKVFRKMFTTNNSFRIKDAFISEEYTLKDLNGEKVEFIRAKSKQIGGIYFDYGYANEIKNRKNENKKIKIGKIDFSDNQYNEMIEGIVQILSMIPQNLMANAVFFVDGHTDYVSSHDFNQKLSESRAICIKEMLMKLGIKREQIFESGHSWDNLVINTESECAENRRVEIKVAFVRE